MLRVALFGIYYPIAILRYFERAFRRRDDVDLRTVGPYTGTWIPWEGGMHLSDKYALPPDVQIYSVGIPPRTIPVNFVEGRLKNTLGDWYPDVWVVVDAGVTFDRRPSRGLVVVVATDPHALDYGQSRKVAHLFYNMQYAYAQKGDRILPYAYDVECHREIDFDMDIVYGRHDVGFLGVLYNSRRDIVEEMRKSGLTVLHRLGLGFDETRIFYAHCTVAFHRSSLNDLAARPFELAAMGVPAVVNRVPYMEEFFGDDSFLFAETPQEFAQQVRQLVEDGSLRNALRANAIHRVKPHTYDARVAQIVQDVMEVI